MQKIKLKLVHIFLIISLCISFLFYFYTNKFKKLEAISSFSPADISEIQKDFKGGIISLGAVADVQKGGEAKIKFKLFSLFNVKTINKPIKNEKIVYLGGDVFDFNLRLRGVVVLQLEDVKMDVGRANPLKNSGIKCGDRIIKINDKPVLDASSFSQEIEKSSGEIKITYIQNGKEIEKKVTPVKDRGGINKLGVWVKDDSLGTGTLSFVESETNNFVALGHNIQDFETGAGVECHAGEVKPCSVIGVKKSRRGVVGELKTISKINSEKTGEIIGNNEFGIFGKITNEKFFNSRQKMQVASALEVKVGKAQMVCTNELGKRQFFDVEIVKVEPEKNVKNLSIKITDKMLLETTGGIVQGMSGSPIIQNGKLAGILTHCFVNNPQRGFGVLATNVI